MSNGDVKVYIITFGVLDVNMSALVQYLYDSADIIAFWNYVPLIYCVKSRATATELARKLQPFFPHGTFFIAEINPSNADGMLPHTAWEWFYLHHHEKHRQPTPPSAWNPLTGTGVAGIGLANLLNPPDKK